MARTRSSLASLIVALVATGLAGCLLNGLGPSTQRPSAFVPAPLVAAQAEERLAVSSIFLTDLSSPLTRALLFQLAGQMARTRSSLASFIVALAAVGLVGCLQKGLGPSTQRLSAFVAAPFMAARVEERLAAQQADANRALHAAVLGAAAMQPAPALALEEDEEGFDVRILAVLALPL
eukprot:CAMPEP_0179133752 /NCGR_PEP_ID=MMETSP0796-20121207/63616_1 /TAXON_ID=73915 /ORGANISM="Pyrodinium bahamense, Strain pbaha01" /LENGTH=177 /DNA_ID=CAMNT_0020832721 /DNA_START=93 /DNA_END=623 /DNA_ORIENTATION=+